MITLNLPTQEPGEFTSVPQIRPQVIDVRDATVLDHQRFVESEELAWAEEPFLEAQADAAALATGVPPEQWKAAKDLLEMVREHSCNVCNHCLRVGLLAMVAADYFEVPPHEALLAGMLHDVGKVAIPRPVLEKSIAGLEWLPDDRLAMNDHVERGATLIKSYGLPTPLANVVSHHHALQAHHPLGSIERLDEKSLRLLMSLTLADFADASYRHDRQGAHTTAELRLATLRSHVEHMMTQVVPWGIRLEPQLCERMLNDLIKARELISEGKQTEGLNAQLLPLPGVIVKPVVVTRQLY
jgi:putative nucleotidyltransferase with HDIG domain